MQPSPIFQPGTQVYAVPAGTVLRQRQETPEDVLHLLEGTVLLCVRDGTHIRQQLGSVHGPVWLDAGPAMLNMPCAVDMLAGAGVRLYRQSLADFQCDLHALPPTAQSLLRDLALAHRQQTELTVSRLSQDAESRCAQWLLHHARKNSVGTLSVTLRERKRSIAAQLGIAPETFSRVLRSLREHGLILGSGKTLELPRPGALQRLAQG